LLDGRLQEPAKFSIFLPGKTLTNCLFQTLPSVPDLTLGKVFDLKKTKKLFNYTLLSVEVLALGKIQISQLCRVSTKNTRQSVLFAECFSWTLGKIIFFLLLASNFFR
jgi:hypothetical protein